MNKGINLLDYKNRPSPINNDKRQKRIRLIALVTLFFVSSISMIFFILVALSPIPELRRQQKTASANLSRANQDIAKLALIKDRALNIRELIDERPAYEETLENIQKKIPAGVTIRAFSVYKKDVTITLVSNSLLPLDTFLNDIINADNSGKEFSNIRLINLAAERNKSSFLMVITPEHNMRKKVFFGQNDIRFYYYRYKDSSYYSWSLIVATTIVVIVLILNVIIPLIRSNLSIRNEVIALTAKIKILNQNINFMNNLDKSVLDSQLQTTTQALPADKEYLSILSALSEASAVSGVTLDDFNFSNSKSSLAGASQSISLNIVINGNITKVKKFLKQINERLPISKIVSVDNTGDATTIGIVFHYKSFPDAIYKEDEPITPLSDSDQDLLRKISQWEVGSSFDDFESSDSSPSGAVPIF